MQGKVEICGVNTAKLPVLKAAETRALLERARAGDRGAREKLIAGNLRLVLSVIQKFTGRGESMDDLFQVGCIGLIKAVDAFDLSQNVQFSTYGVPMIAGELRRFLRDHSSVRVSRSMRDTAYKVLQAKERLIAEQGREPDVEQIASALGIPRQEVVFALDRREKHILALRFYDGRTQMEVARAVGISQAQVSRLEKNAIKRIKKELGQ